MAMDVTQDIQLEYKQPPRKKAKCQLERNSAKRDLASLPYSVLLNIFKHLDMKSLGICATLCTTLNRVSHDPILYNKVTLKYNMGIHFLESLVSKIACPRELSIEYKHVEGSSVESEMNQEFDKYIRITLTKCGETLDTLKIDNCRNENILQLMSECTNLKELCLYRCKSNFSALASIGSLQTIQFVYCHFPQKIVNELVRNSQRLRVLHLVDNTNVNVNEVCETLSRYNEHVSDVYFSERKRLRSKSLRTLGRLTNLRHLALISAPGFECDPEDSLEQIATGCAKLERLSVHGWNEIGDDQLQPVLHMCAQLKELDLRGLNITIKSCREAALSLTQLRVMDVIKCKKVNKTQLAKLKREFEEIHIPLELT